MIYTIANANEGTAYLDFTYNPFNELVIMTIDHEKLIKPITINKDEFFKLVDRLKQEIKNLHKE